MHGKHKSVLPLTHQEVGAFNRMLMPAQPPFQAWLGDEIFKQTQTPTSHSMAGGAAFATGAVSALVGYYLAVKLMKIFGADSGAAAAMGVVVLIPRIALGGNALQDCMIKALHDYHQKHRLPSKKNQRALRMAADAFVYISSASLGLMGAYILWNNMPYSVPLRAFLLPSIILGNGIVNVQPFLDANEALFAHYSPGSSPAICDKRAALIEALHLSLNEIRGMKAEDFGRFFEEMTRRPANAEIIQARWDRLLDLAINPIQAAPAPKSSMTKARGYFGWLLSILSSLTNIQISYAVALWLADAMGNKESNFVPAYGAISSFLCFSAYAVLCAGPTRAVFENQRPNQNWEPSHPELRTLVTLLSVLFGFASAIPNASWPIVLGTTWYEKSLAGPAFISPGALYMAALSILLNRLIDSVDRWRGNSQVIDYMDFLAKLETLPNAVAQCSDETIETLVPLDHPLLIRYQTNHRSELHHGRSPQSPLSLNHVHPAPQSNAPVFDLGPV